MFSVHHLPEQGSIKSTRFPEIINCCNYPIKACTIKMFNITAAIIAEKEKVT